MVRKHSIIIIIIIIIINIIIIVMGMVHSGSEPSLRTTRRVESLPESPRARARACALAPAPCTCPAWAPTAAQPRGRCLRTWTRQSHSRTRRGDQSCDHASHSLADCVSPLRFSHVRKALGQAQQPAALSRSVRGQSRADVQVARPVAGRGHLRHGHADDRGGGHQGQAVETLGRSKASLERERDRGEWVNRYINNHHCARTIDNTIPLSSPNQTKTTAIAKPFLSSAT